MVIRAFLFAARAIPTLAASRIRHCSKKYRLSKRLGAMVALCSLPIQLAYPPDVGSGTAGYAALWQTGCLLWVTQWASHRQRLRAFISTSHHRPANALRGKQGLRGMLMRKTIPREPSWFTTTTGEQRGYIQPHALHELWFHTGTACNLECPFCLEGSKPGDNRLNRIVLADIKPFIDEAASLGVRQFSFTGGEPFIVKDFVNILHYASTFRPCLVLTNGTDPVLKRLHHIERLADSRNPISFRISLDYPDEDRHDKGRGVGNFLRSIKALQRLFHMGFPVSVARQMETDEDSVAVDLTYRSLLIAHGLPEDLRIVAFPDFDIPNAKPDVPEVTEGCMTRYQTEETRRAFMCAFSKMVVKRNGAMRVYACTLVDDDPEYDLGGSLREAQTERILMRHHRCHTCFAFGSSCSEL